MTPERWKLARTLFDKAAELSPADAEAYLREQCGEDGELFSVVQGMLAEKTRTGSLDRPLWELVGAPAPAPPVFSVGELVAGRYRIVRYLNRGGMGEVYEAEHPLLPDHVALKTLLPAIASDQAMIERFKQEIQLARKIAHPNVCKLFDLEWHQQGTSRVFFLTMELLQGETLFARLHRQGRMRAEEALPLLDQMAEALHAAHGSGVIHRDFKSPNVMLVPSAGGTRAVVTDFGLARSVAAATGSTVSMSNKVVGTLQYMAPELLKGAQAAFRSDIYALGMVAYEMVTGALPFAGETPLAAAILRSQKPVPSPRKLAPDIDPKWDAAILRALDPDPGRRFAEVREFPRALRGEAVPAPPPAPSPLRRKVLAAACVVAAMAAGWEGWRWWVNNRYKPSPEAARFYQLGVDDIHAGAYYAATTALDQAVNLSPGFSPARARLAESWLELDLPEKAALEFMHISGNDNPSLPRLDRLLIEAVGLTITREFAAAVARYEAMRKLAGNSVSDLDVDLGRAYEKANKPDSAIAAYRRVAEGPWHSAAAWLRLAVLYSRGGKLAESDAAFAEADRAYRQISNLEGITELTLQQGVAANRKQKYTDAAVLLRKAIDYAHDAGNIQQEISAKLTLANTYNNLGDTGRGESLAKESLAIAQAKQMKQLTIRGLINLGYGYFRRGDYVNAEPHFRDALDLALSTNSQLLAAQSRFHLANTYDQLHRSEEQIRAAKAALAYYQPNHWVRETFDVLVLIARGEESQNNFEAARVSFQMLLDESNKAQDRANIARAQEGLGDVMSAQENYPQALGHYREFMSSNSSDLIAPYPVLDCAITLVRLGRSPEALPLFARAEAAAGQQKGSLETLAQYRAEMALTRNDYRDVIGRTRRAILEITNLSPSTEADLARLLGLARLRSGDRQAGLRNCQEAFAASQKLDDPSELLEARLALLEALLATRDSAGAASVFHDMEPALGAHPESRWRALVLLARSDRQYADRAKQALDQLGTLWGHDALAVYLKRPDVRQIWPLLPANSANH